MDASASVGIKTLGLVVGFALVGGCTKAPQTSPDALIAAIRDLANDTVPLAVARQEVDAAFENWDSSLYRSAMEAFVRGGGDFFSLVERSKAIEPCVIDVNSKTTAHKTSQTVVLYVNGLATDYTGARADAASLAAALKGCMNSADVELVYNPTGVTGLVGDLVEATSQALTDFVSKPMDITNLDALSTQLFSRIEEALSANDRIIIVAYSQGNYYTSAALSLLTSAELSRISVIQVGSPEGDWPSGLVSNRAIAVDGDPIALLSNGVETTVPYEGGYNGWGTWLVSLLAPVFPQFALFETLKGALDRHSFTGAYLQGTARDTLLNYLCEGEEGEGEGEAEEGEGEGKCPDLAGDWLVVSGLVTGQLTVSMLGYTVPFFYGPAIEPGRLIHVGLFSDNGSCGISLMGDIPSTFVGQVTPENGYIRATDEHYWVLEGTEGTGYYMVTGSYLIGLISPSPTLSIGQMELSFSGTHDDVILTELGPEHWISTISGTVTLRSCHDALLSARWEPCE